ncbi:hypothetical protein ACIQVT_13805 [Streptomyces sp. NPDC100445]|uniref:hypothetical protein n=1 Tax=Streptomyces sp. NPDC100445 TaxID=3366102 RepID=UPI0037F1A401
MGYALEAVIAGEEPARAVARAVPGARVVPLGRGLALVPVTDEVRAAVTGGTGPATLGFRWLPAEFDALLAQGSALGPVAYVEAEYFGGVGEERAAVWSAGALALGPLDAPTRRLFRRAAGPVCRALRRLGVRRGPGRDEFEAVGLGRHRDTEDWVSSGATR